jgi:NDP-sugar pyrophosphorylase family protein
MRAAILAGGRGTRIEAVYPDLPKPMIPIAGKPLLQHHVEALALQGICEITLIIGYKADVIRNHFGNGSAFGAHIDYIVEDEPLGTGGALALLPREDTLVLFGDVYFDIDLERFINFHKEKQAAIALFAHSNSHPYDSDIIIADSYDKVIDWKSKKDKQRGNLRNLVNAGLYIFSGNSLPGGKAIKCDLEHDLILRAIPQGKVFAYRSTEYVKDMGTPERLVSVDKIIKSGMAAMRNLKNKQHAVFLDYGDIMEQMNLIPGVANTIRMLNESPFLAIGIAKQIENAAHLQMDTLLGNEGAYLDEFVELKMLLKTVERYNIYKGCFFSIFQ